MAKKNGNKYRFELSIYSIIFGSFCFLFSLGCIFAVGIMVGKNQISGSIPVLSNLKKPVEPPPLPPPVAQNTPPPEPVKPPTKTEEPPPKLDFYTMLDNKKESPKKKPEPPPIEGTGAPAGGNKIKFEPLRKEQSPPAEPKAANVPIPKKETVVGTGSIQFTVQLASLESKEKAEKMVQSLKAHSHAAYFYEVKIQGKVYYRVRCGRFNTREEASIYAVKLSSEENLQGFVTKLE
jgi:septal ring-binding cell division protein DamX